MIIIKSICTLISSFSVGTWLEFEHWKYEVVSTVNFFWVGNWIYEIQQNLKSSKIFRFFKTKIFGSDWIGIKKICWHIVKYSSKKTRPNILCALHLACTAKLSRIHLTKVPEPSELTIDLQSRLCELLNIFFSTLLKQRPPIWIITYIFAAQYFSGQF